MTKQTLSILSKVSGIRSDKLEKLKAEEVSNTIVRVFLSTSYVDYDLSKGCIVDYHGAIQNVKSLAMILGDISHLHIYNMYINKFVIKDRILDNERDVFISATVEIMDFKTLLKIYTGEICVESCVVRNDVVWIDDSNTLHIIVSDVELSLTFEKFVTQEEVNKLRKKLCYGKA